MAPAEKDVSSQRFGIFKQAYSRIQNTEYAPCFAVAATHNGEENGLDHTNLSLPCCKIRRSSVKNSIVKPASKNQHVRNMSKERVFAGFR